MIVPSLSKETFEELRAELFYAERLLYRLDMSTDLSGCTKLRATLHEVAYKKIRYDEIVIHFLNAHANTPATIVVIHNNSITRRY
jgi:hypothetical protein